MIFADTGYFLALANPRDQHHQRAMRWSGRLNERLIVSEYVLVEAVNALSRRDLRPSAWDVMDSIQRDPQFEFVSSTPQLLLAGLKLHRDRSDKSWSLTDCISFNIMAERGITQALAHDQHFEQAGFEALLRRDP
jgi:predicted nucleic acid-binding protein